MPSMKYRTRFRIRTIMIAIAAIAILMVPVKIAFHNPGSIWMLLGVVAIFGPSFGFLVFPIAVDWIAGTQNRVSSKYNESSGQASARRPNRPV